MAFVKLSFGGKEISTHELTEQATVVGRDPGSDIVIDNLGVSRSHCQFIRRGDVFVLQDMNSANGTYVNGRRVGEHNLNEGDQIVVGKYALTFSIAAGAAEEAPEPAAGGVKAVPASGPVIPDALNTYMMDGEKIKERLEEMRRMEEAKASPEPPTARQQPERKRGAAPSVAQPQAPAPQAESGGRVEHHTRIIMGGSAKGGQKDPAKRYLHVALVLIAVLVLAVIALLVFSMFGGG